MQTPPFKLLPKDYAWLMWRPRREHLIRWLFLCALIWPIMLLLALWWRASALGWGEAVARVFNEPAAEIGFLFALLFWPALQLLAPWRVSHIQAKASEVAGTRIVLLSPDFLSVHDRLGDVRRPWSVIPRVDISRDYLLLPMAEKSYLVGNVLIPRHAFASDADFNAFAAKANELWSTAHAAVPPSPSP